MTLLCYDSLYLEHDTGNHPESSERLKAVWDHLTETGLDKKCESSTWGLATNEQVGRVHDLSYINVIKQSAELGGGPIEADTMMSELSHHVAMHASGAVCHSVEHVLAGKQKNALCLVRPPGHHARPRNAMGFCLFNHIAVGAKHAIEGVGVDRVLVVDWDVHHGNGTQESFYEEENIGFFSIHRSPFFPGTGKESDTGKGAGLGMTSNVEVAFGTDREVYFERFEKALVDIAKKTRPDLVMISAGFDAHRSDPIGSLGLETEDFDQLTRQVVGVANEYCGGKIVSMLEGGYNPSVLPHCVETHLKVLLEQ